jgi:outer membrane lipoprotein-sorting protein
MNKTKRARQMRASFNQGIEVKLFIVFCLASFLVSSACAQDQVVSEALVAEVGQLGILESISFDVAISTETLSSYEGIKSGYKQKTFFNYRAKRGSSEGAENLFFYDLKLIDNDGKSVLDLVTTYNPESYATLDRLSGRMSVDKVLPGPYDLLRTKAGVFLPLRFIAVLANGKPTSAEGFLFSLNQLNRFDLAAYKKTVQMSTLTQEDEWVKKYWPESSCFKINFYPPEGKTQLVDSSYVVALNGQKKISGWTYFENKKPVDSLLIQDRVKRMTKSNKEIELMAKGEMLHYHEGNVVSKSVIQLSAIQVDAEISDSLFEVDPSVAKSIYDRQTRKLIPVLK